jgi:hypothetical protein
VVKHDRVNARRARLDESVKTRSGGVEYMA